MFVEMEAVLSLEYKIHRVKEEKRDGDKNKWKKTMKVNSTVDEPKTLQ